MCVTFWLVHFARMAPVRSYEVLLHTSPVRSSPFEQTALIQKATLRLDL